MQVDDIGTHTVQEVLRVWDEHEDSLKPDKNHQVDQKWVLIHIRLKWRKQRETYDLSSSSNHTQASRSKWLVGSSSSSMKGLMNKALQRCQTAEFKAILIVCLD